MFKSISKLFGGSKNPTAEWPVQSKPELVYDMRSRSINGLKLNGEFAGAQIFGRCDEFKRYDEFLDLFYCQFGLSLGFASDRLVGVVFVVGQGSFLVKERKMGICCPAIVDPEGLRHVLTDTSTLPDLIPCFGEPVESGPVGNDMVHSFTSHKNFVDTYHDPNTGRSLNLEICETNDA